MCSSICGYFLCRVPSRRCALAVGQIRIGIPILPPFKVLAPRAIVEVPTSNWALLGLGGCEGAMTFSLRVGAAGRSCWGEPWIRKTWSHAPFLCLSVSATTPGRHFAPGRVASFAEGRVGYRERARRSRSLGSTRSIQATTFGYSCRGTSPLLASTRSLWK
jgi:hypothetical protein